MGACTPARSCSSAKDVWQTNSQTLRALRKMCTLHLCVPNLNHLTIRRKRPEKESATKTLTPGTFKNWLWCTLHSHRRSHNMRIVDACTAQEVPIEPTSYALSVRSDRWYCEADACVQREQRKESHYTLYNAYYSHRIHAKGAAPNAGLM